MIDKEGENMRWKEDVSSCATEVWPSESHLPSHVFTRPRLSNKLFESQKGRRGAMRGSLDCFEEYSDETTMALFSWDFGRED